MELPANLEMTDKYSLALLFISDTMSSFFGACTCVCHFRHPFRCFIISSSLKHFFTLPKPNRLCCYDENGCCLCLFIVFVQEEGIYSYLFFIFYSSANSKASRCLLCLSSVCLLLSSHFPPPAPHPVSLQSLLCNLSASHSPDPALPSSELKPDRCWGLMF